MTGNWLVISLALAVILMIVAISRWKVHPFLAIIAVSIILAAVVGIPLEKIPSIVSKGFAGVLANIGIVIILGMLTGLILERTGAAVKLANGILKYVGPKYPQIAMLLIGWIISIPVFCDSGFVIVNPIRKSLAQKTKISPVTLTLSLAGGLYVSHLFIPPTPGPIAAAGLVGIEDNLLILIFLGIIVSIPTLIVVYIFSSYIGKRVKHAEERSSEIQNHNVSVNDHTATDDVRSEVDHNEKLPSFIASLIPILLPLVLMSIDSIISIHPSDSFFYKLFSFLGEPIIALGVALISTLPLLFKTKKIKDLYKIADEAQKSAGPIIFITAAGGVLGQVIVESGFVSYIQENANALSALGLFFPFVIAAVLKSAQGSSTVSMITTAGIMGLYSSDSSLMYALGLTNPVSASLTVLSIAAGSMMVSHANDSYFWVVTNIGDINHKDGYKTHTLMTLFTGLASIVTIYLLSLVLR